MKATLDETKVLCRGNETTDPLFNTDSEAAAARIVELNGGLYLPGATEDEPDGYADDLWIVPVENGWMLYWRDPKGVTEPLWGREWQGGGLHEEWISLVHSAYSL